MPQSTAEVPILAINALGAGIPLFIARVVQKIMDDMDELVFKRFLISLGHAAMTDALAVTIATLPIIAAVLYFVAYGFGHWWFTAALGSVILMACQFGVDVAVIVALSVAVTPPLPWLAGKYIPG